MKNYEDKNYITVHLNDADLEKFQKIADDYYHGDIEYAAHMELQDSILLHESKSSKLNYLIQKETEWRKEIGWPEQSIAEYIEGLINQEYDRQKRLEEEEKKEEEE